MKDSIMRKNKTWKRIPTGDTFLGGMVWKRRASPRRKKVGWTKKGVVTKIPGS